MPSRWKRLWKTMGDDVPIYRLRVPCAACNRELGMPACPLCAQIEYATRSATGERSPQLDVMPTRRKDAQR